MTGLPTSDDPRPGAHADGDPRLRGFELTTQPPRLLPLLCVQDLDSTEKLRHSRIALCDSLPEISDPILAIPDLTVLLRNLACCLEVRNRHCIRVRGRRRGGRTG